jgi:hypothetical protein
MFEKEADEYAKENKKVYGSDEYADITDYSNVKETFQKAAEFGYNKANEWHYVKDGDLPRQDRHTCFSIEVLANNKKWVYYEFGSGKWFCGNKEVNVYAWKEIILPKE